MSDSLNRDGDCMRLQFVSFIVSILPGPTTFRDVNKVHWVVTQLLFVIENVFHSQQWRTYYIHYGKSTKHKRDKRNNFDMQKDDLETTEDQDKNQKSNMLTMLRSYPGC